ncbi:MAG TPA: alkaline phosphatase family protein [Chloroflexota bacterium]|nr:alkaline phosphatase family protein [Chloroflexota bacterium]
MQAPSPLLPRYGEGSLADLTPSLLASMGVAEFGNVLGLPECERACLVVLDGLGWELLRHNAEHAPFLRSLLPSARPITAGFPSTTAASVASIGCGLPPAEHGVLGYALTLPGHSRPMNMLRWQVYGTGQGGDLREKLHPEKFQPRQTAFETAAAAGVEVQLIGPAAHDQSGLSRAALRGGRFQAAVSGGDLASCALAHLQGSGRKVVYAHHNDLDTTGHSRGAASEAWRIQLGLADRLCERMAERLPAGCTLIITGDHGMVDLAPHQRLDLDDHRELSAGVRVMAGEGRARYLYTQHGAEQDVLGAWREALGDRMWVLSREEAIEAGWFGPDVPEAYAARIGEVIAAAFGPVGIFQRSVDPSQASMVGHHGSLTPEEMLVPLLVVNR